jgi:hypothetical protein
MDQFEEAKRKAQKRIERQAKYAAPQVPDTVRSGADGEGAAPLSSEPLSPQSPIASPAVTAPETPKEKPNADAVITVWVQLPDTSFSMKLVKRFVYQSAVKSKLTKQNIRNGIIEGLKPLLGGVNELPGGS